MQSAQLMILGLMMATTSLAFPGQHVQHVDYYAHPKYNYDYAVHDLHTGDVKNKWETRDGDVVKGAYSVNEPDGTIRKVEYTADKHNGFNAVVHRLGKAVHPEVVHSHGGYGGHYAGDLSHHSDGTSFASGNNIAYAHYGGYHH